MGKRMEREKGEMTLVYTSGLHYCIHLNDFKWLKEIHISFNYRLKHFMLVFFNWGAYFQHE